jgi:hypothetical protein
MTHSDFTSALRPVLAFPFQDRQSRERFLIGCGLTLAGFIVPILPGLITWGYALGILRASARGEQPAMPAWDDVAGYLGLGFRGAIVCLVFTLPGLVVFLFGFAAYFGTFTLIPLSAESRAITEDTLMLTLMLGIGTMFVSLALGMLLFVLGAAPLPAALAHLVVEDKLGAAFKPGEWWPVVRANRMGFFIAFVVLLGVYTIMQLVFALLYYTLVLLCVAYVVLPASGFYASLVAAALFGAAYREGRAVA